MEEVQIREYQILSSISQNPTQMSIRPRWTAELWPWAMDGWGGEAKSGRAPLVVLKRNWSLLSLIESRKSGIIKSGRIEEWPENGVN